MEAGRASRPAWVGHWALQCQCSAISRVLHPTFGVMWLAEAAGLLPTDRMALDEEQQGGLRVVGFAGSEITLGELAVRCPLH